MSQSKRKPNCRGWGGIPARAVICGNSEIEQQVGMLGLDPALGRGPFFGEDLPGIAADAVPAFRMFLRLPAAAICRSARATASRTISASALICGPLEDVRRAEVRFASECLAFANVPEPEMIDEMALRDSGRNLADASRLEAGVCRAIRARAGILKMFATTI